MLDRREELHYLTSSFRLSGHPAISGPCGFTEQGLLIGLQLAGRRSESSPS